MSLITPTILYYIYQKLLGKQKSIINSLKYGLKTWPKIIGYGILTNIIFAAGLVVLIIPGIILMFRMLFVFVVITIEGNKGINPISVSNSMAKGKVWKLFSYTIRFSLITILPLFFIGIIFSLLTDGWIENVIVDVVSDLSIVLFTVMSLIMYLSIKNHDVHMEVDSK